MRVCCVIGGDQLNLKVSCCECYSMRPVYDMADFISEVETPCYRHRIRRFGSFLICTVVDDFLTTFRNFYRLPSTLR